MQTSGVSLIYRKLKANKRLQLLAPRELMGRESRRARSKRRIMPREKGITSRRVGALSSECRAAREIGRTFGREAPPPCAVQRHRFCSAGISACLRRLQRVAPFRLIVPPRGRKNIMRVASFVPDARHPPPAETGGAAPCRPRDCLRRGPTERAGSTTGPRAQPNWTCALAAPIRGSPAAIVRRAADQLK